MRVALLPAQHVPGRAASQHRQPEAVRRVAAEAADRGDRPNEGVLRRLERQLPIADQAISVPPDVVLQRATQRLERLPIPTRGATSHRFDVAGAHWLLRPFWLDR